MWFVAMHPRASLMAFPPASPIGAIWHNMCCLSDCETIETVLSCGPERLFVQVAERLRAGLYHLVSMNINSSSLIVVCETERPLEEFHQALRKIPSSHVGSKL